MARKSKLVAFRMPERMGWKLEKMGERNGLSAAQMAKLMVMEQVGRLSEQEERQFVMQIERPRRGQERTAQATQARSVSPAMAAARLSDVPDFDSNGLPRCPRCHESTKFNAATSGHEPSVSILDGNTGWFACRYETCGAQDYYEPFIGLEQTNPMTVLP